MIVISETDTLVAVCLRGVLGNSDNKTEEQRLKINILQNDTAIMGILIFYE